jgi:hypothetical protein
MEKILIRAYGEVTMIVGKQRVTFTRDDIPALRALLQHLVKPDTGRKPWESVAQPIIDIKTREVSK